MNPPKSEQGLGGSHLVKRAATGSVALMRMRAGGGDAGARPLLVRAEPPRSPLLQRSKRSRVDQGRRRPRVPALSRSDWICSWIRGRRVALEASLVSRRQCLLVLGPGRLRRVPTDADVGNLVCPIPKRLPYVELATAAPERWRRAPSGGEAVTAGARAVAARRAYAVSASTPPSAAAVSAHSRVPACCCTTARASARDSAGR
jgi:hypothetical protein